MQNKLCHGAGKPGACTSGVFTLVLVARRSRAAQLHVGGLPERVHPQDPSQGRGTAAAQPH